MGVAPVQVHLQLRKARDWPRIACIARVASLATGNASPEIGAGSTKPIAVVASILPCKTSRVEDCVTRCRGNSNTLTFTNLTNRCKRVATGDTSGQLRWRTWRRFGPTDKTGGLGWCFRWAHRLTINVENCECEIELFGVEMEIAKNRIVPGAVGPCRIGPQRIAVRDVGQRLNRLALGRVTDV